MEMPFFNYKDKSVVLKNVTFEERQDYIIFDNIIRLHKNDVDIIQKFISNNHIKQSYIYLERLRRKCSLNYLSFRIDQVSNFITDEKEFLAINLMPMCSFSVLISMSTFVSRNYFRTDFDINEFLDKEVKRMTNQLDNFDAKRKNYKNVINLDSNGIT